MDKYIGISIYPVYGDDFREPITKEHAKIIEKMIITWLKMIAV